MIVFYNPQGDDFLAEPPHFKILKRRPLKKYGHLLQEHLGKHGVIDVYIDNTISVFIPEEIFWILPGWLRGLIVQFEFKRWLAINNLDGRINLVKASKQNHILVAFTYKAATGRLFRKRLHFIKQFKTVIMHLSHYFILTSEKSKNLQMLSYETQLYLAGDSDITGNAYYRRFFNWYRNIFLLIPFAIGSRFLFKKDFSARENKALATGTFHNLTLESRQRRYLDFQSFFQTDTYHPVRKEIFQHTEDLKDIVDSRINLFKDYSKSNSDVSQKKYFSLDIVELYNAYQFAVVGEEATGFPALGAFEAMASGAILIAQTNFYAGLGLLEGQHYYPYDGTLRGLRMAIETLRARPELCLQIQKNGLDYARNLNAVSAYQNFKQITGTLPQ